MSKKPSFRDQREWTHLYEELKAESDRGCAVIGGAMIDDSLSKLIANFLIDDQSEVDDLLKPGGSINRMEVKARLAYCLGLIAKELKDDLITIAKIRNHFAHNLHDASFDQGDVRNLCENLKFYYESWFPKPYSEIVPSRQFFQTAVAMLIYNLALQSTMLSSERRTARNSPKYPF